MPDPPAERPSTYRNRARLLLRDAAALSRASTPGEDDAAAQMACLRSEAEGLLERMRAMQANIERAASHPATHHTRAAWGAAPGEPEHEFPRALRRTLLELGVPVETADKLIDTAGSAAAGDGEEGREGRGQGLQGLQGGDQDEGKGDKRRRKR